jgi:hypothetical protein
VPEKGGIRKALCARPEAFPVAASIDQQGIRFSENGYNQK